MDLSASRGELAPVAPQTPLSPSTRPTLADPLPTLPDPLDLGLGAAERSATSPPGAPRVAIAAAFLIALLLPTSGRPPWALLDQPAGPTALALAGLLLLPGLTAGPPHLVRWALRLVVVVTLTALTALALADGYAHPPWGDALDPLHGSLSLLGLSLVLGAALAGSRASPPRLVAGTGLLLLVAAAFIPNDPGVPLLRLIGALTAADSSAADTGAALTTLAFAALALATGVLRLARPGRHLALALTTWLLAIAPLVVHAALSTPPSTWMDTLAPVKAALAFAAALLCCATALTPALEPETPQPAAGQAF